MFRQLDWFLGAEGRIWHFQTVEIMSAVQDDKKGGFSRPEEKESGVKPNHAGEMILHLNLRGLIAYTLG